MTWGSLLNRLWRLLTPMPRICEDCVARMICTSYHSAHGLTSASYECTECGWAYGWIQ